MINFRYHLVSLVAVFLALAIGIVAGSTVIKESILNQTQQNLDRAEQNLKDLEDSNAALRSQLDQLNRRDAALDHTGIADFLRDRLTGLPVLLMKVDGVDDGAATALRQAFVAAGAGYVGTVTFTERLNLTTPADVAALQEILSESTMDPVVLRADLAARLGTLVTGVADSRPGLVIEPPPTTTTQAGMLDLPTTATTLSAARLASDGLRGFLKDLDGAGFAKLSDQPGDAQSLVLGGLRVVVMSGAGAKLDNAVFLYPFLQRMVGGAKPSTLALEATPPGSEVGRGSFVGAIRHDGSLSAHVSTVDDAEWFVGRAAAVMAVSALIVGAVGHYGVGDGASELLPSAASTGRP